MKQGMAPQRGKKVQMHPLVVNSSTKMPDKGLTKVFHPKEIDDIKDAFSTLDTDSDGKISPADLSAILGIFGSSSHLSEETYLKQLLDDVDADKKGQIELGDVLEVMKYTTYNSSTCTRSSSDGDDNLKHAFSVMDRNNSGFVDVKEIKEFLKQSSHLLKDIEIDVSDMHQFDEDYDGRLSFHEFKQMISRPNSERKITNPCKTQKVWYAEKEKARSNNCFTSTTKFYLVAVGIPLFFALLYAIAILFPPDAREKAPLFLWTKGQLVMTDGKPILCPVNKPCICSEGVAQIIFIVIARLTAFASYVIVGFVFVSKMHSTIHFLSSTFFSQAAPIENMHRMHSIMGLIYGSLAFVHTTMHIVRWGMRGELALLVDSSLGLSGLVGILAMTVVVLSMTLAKRFKTRISFEARLAAHWSLTLLVLAMAFHTPCCRTITLIFFFLWVVDYLYTYLFRTHRLDIVEFSSLPGGSGCQLLWRNPEKFKVRAGQYVQIQVPWLSKGGKEWHPFSVYLNEATEEGLMRSSHPFVGRLFDDEEEERLMEMQDEPLSEDEFVRIFLDQEYQHRDENEDLLYMEAREEQRHETTQIFIVPVGDWSQCLNQQVMLRNHLSSCWVRGPYTSPYHVGDSFSHLVLTATGIGITPSLAVGAQFPGYSRTKILIWSCKCATMLKFFAPLFKDFHMIMIYYTGKEKLSTEDARQIRSNPNGIGNIFLKTSRGDFTNAISVVVSAYESEMMDSSHMKSIADVPKEALKTWCFMYCGGSKKICDDLKCFSRKHGVSFRSEQFDW